MAWGLETTSYEKTSSQIEKFNFAEDLVVVHGEGSKRAFKILEAKSVRRLDSLFDALESKVRTLSGDLSG